MNTNPASVNSSGPVSRAGHGAQQNTHDTSGSIDPVDVNAAEPRKVPWAAVIVYSVVACALAWLVMLPIWLGDGLADPLFAWLVLPMMYTPAVAALIVTFFMVKPKYKARYLGLTPFKPVWRSIILILIWPIAFLAISIGAILVAHLFGWAQFGFNLAALEPGAEMAGLSAESLAVLNFVLIPLIVVQATFSAFGEELGWRGFLVPALSPLGFWPTTIISSVIWGVWHAPIILLGYNFARTDFVGILMMIGFCLSLGVLFNWARMWCRNVWVAAVGHGAINAVAPLSFIFIMDPDPEGTFLQTVLGFPGWIVSAVIVIVMAALGLFGKRLPKPLVTVPAKFLTGSARASGPVGAESGEGMPTTGSEHASAANPSSEPVVGTPEWAQGYTPAKRSDGSAETGQTELDGTSSSEHPPQS